MSTVEQAAILHDVLRCSDFDASLVQLERHFSGSRPMDL